jgi:hypothetical protein
MKEKKQIPNEANISLIEGNKFADKTGTKPEFSSFLLIS